MPVENGAPRPKSSWRIGLDYAVTFAPWVSYIVFSKVVGSWKHGFAVGLGEAAAIVGWRTIRRDNRIMDTGTLLYCALLTGISWSYPTSPLRPYNVPLSMLAVGSLAALSLAARKPFTLRAEEKHLDPAIVSDSAKYDTLYKGHAVATRAWCGSQVAAGSLSALLIGVLPHGAGSVGSTATQAVGTLVPAAVTRVQHVKMLAKVRAHFHHGGAAGNERAPTAPATGARVEPSGEHR